jgi:molecular chaperone HscB
MNYFTKLGLEVEYDIDQDLLEKKYLEYQRKFHPDKYINAQESERLRAIQETIEINTAYKTLKSALKRAEYIMSLHGINIDREDDLKINQGILLEALDDRQKLEDTVDVVGLKNLSNKIKEEIAQGLKIFATKLHENNIAQAAYEMYRLRYKNKLLEEIEFKSNV